MKPFIFELMSVAGLVSLGFGLFQWYEPAAYMIIGLILFILGVMGASK